MKSNNLEKYIIILNFKTKPREVKPFKLRSFLSDRCNQKVEELTTDKKNRFSFKFKPILQLNLLSDIKKSKDFSCEIIFRKLLIKRKELFTYRTANSMKRLNNIPLLRFTGTICKRFCFFGFFTQIFGVKKAK